MKYKIVLIISIVFFLSSFSYTDNVPEKKKKYPLYYNHIWVKHKIEQINLRNEIELRRNHIKINKKGEVI